MRAYVGINLAYDVVCYCRALKSVNLLTQLLYTLAKNGRRVSENLAREIIEGFVVIHA